MTLVSEELVIPTSTESFTSHVSRREAKDGRPSVTVCGAGCLKTKRKMGIIMSLTCVGIFFSQRQLLSKTRPQIAAET